MSDPILGFEQTHKVRFTSALWALESEGWNALKLGVVPDRVNGGNVVCVKISRFLTVLRTSEVDDIVKVCIRVKSLPQLSRQFVEAIRVAAEDAKAQTITDAEKAKMI